jgi:hypothetical protein
MLQQQQMQPQLRASQQPSSSRNSSSGQAMHSEASPHRLLLASQ